eukprot:GHVL01010686.1.p1 GENE.GHVL01010686.1~~GHVL01010686.1.p1  ORF type:complete len:284 (+),score=38.04 GHVL01010686.1:326-1177(+)
MSNKDIKNRLAIITGGNCGIGKATAIELCKLNCKVIIACRDMKKGKIAIADIKRASESSQCEIMSLDLADLQSVKDFSSEIAKNKYSIDYLVNNAGVMMIPTYTETKQGHEMQFGTNHLGHFLLTKLLIPQLSNRSRIVNLASIAHLNVPSVSEGFDFSILTKSKYNKMTFYGISKLSNIWFTRKLQTQLDTRRTICSCVHPGVVATQLTRYLYDPKYFSFFPLQKSAFEGCQTTLHCCLHDDIIPGGYYMDCKPSATIPAGMNKKKWDELWEYSENAVKSYL